MNYGDKFFVALIIWQVASMVEGLQLSRVNLLILTASVLFMG